MIFILEPSLPRMTTKVTIVVSGSKWYKENAIFMRKFIMLLRMQVFLLPLVTNKMQRFMQFPSWESPHSKCAISAIPLLMHTDNDDFGFISLPFFLKNLSIQVGKWVCGQSIALVLG